MSDDFRLRFVAIMLKCYFVNDKYIDKCLYAFEHMQDGGYYAQFDRQILEMTKNKIEKIYRLPEADVNRFAEVINEY